MYVEGVFNLLIGRFVCCDEKDKCYVIITVYQDLLGSASVLQKRLQPKIGTTPLESEFFQKSLRNLESTSKISQNHFCTCFSTSSKKELGGVWGPYYIFSGVVYRYRYSRYIRRYDIIYL